jgi:Flp pilus assembly protein TadB
MVTIDLPGHLRWYRMHRNSRVLARLPRTVRIPVAHLSAGSSRGIAIRLVGADFANNKHRLTGKLSAGKAGSDSLVFTVGTTR